MSNALAGLLSWSRTRLPSWYHKGTDVLSKLSVRGLILNRICGRSPRFGPAGSGISKSACAATNTLGHQSASSVKQSMPLVNKVRNFVLYRVDWADVSISLCFEEDFSERRNRRLRCLPPLPRRLYLAHVPSSRHSTVLWAKVRSVRSQFIGTIQ